MTTLFWRIELAGVDTHVAAVASPREWTYFTSKMQLNLKCRFKHLMLGSCLNPCTVFLTN